PMYIEAVPNRGSPPAILLRESYREAGKVKKRTLLNLSDWPHERITGFKALLKGGTVIPQDQDAITIIRSLPHGHVEAVLGTARKIGLDRLLGPDGNRCRDLILALVVSRLVDPGSNLAAPPAAGPRGPPPRGATWSRGGRRGRALWRPRLVGGPPAGDRGGPCQTPSQRRHTGALRRVVELPGRPSLSARPVRLQPRRQTRQTANRLWPALRPRRLSGGNRGLRRQHCRSDHSNQSGDQAEGALRARPCRPGWRPRHDHPSADHRGYQAGRARLDYRLARPGDQGIARRRRAADVAV